MISTLHKISLSKTSLHPLPSPCIEDNRTTIPLLSPSRHAVATLFTPHYRRGRHTSPPPPPPSLFSSLNRRIIKIILLERCLPNKDIVPGSKFLSVKKASLFPPLPFPPPFPFERSDARRRWRVRERGVGLSGSRLQLSFSSPFQYEYRRGGGGGGKQGGKGFIGPKQDTY